MYYCFLVFRHVGKYISLDLFYSDITMPFLAVESSEDLHTLFFEHIEVNLATMERSDASKVRHRERETERQRDREREGQTETKTDRGSVRES